MNLLTSFLGLIGMACITVLGIGASGCLAARRMSESDHRKASTDPTEGDTQS